jgi:putative SOS response-associated peptidase YedK
MCYSAQIKADYNKFQRVYGAVLDLREFVRLFWEKRRDGSWTKIPKAMREPFRTPSSEAGFELAKLVAEGDRDLAGTYEAELDAQQARLAAAEAKLASPKPTKAAANDKRIATNKIAAAQRNLDDLARREIVDRDRRIFPDWYAPVMLVENGQRVVRPMRYHCRPCGMPKTSDRTKEGKVSGKYNARRDNLERFWSNLFGHTHCVMFADAFFENVPLHKYEHRDLRPGEREQNVVLKFDPSPAQEMLVACLWSPWTEGEEQLNSFAAITDEPPPEVAAAGHDRCIIPIKPEHLDAWLNPDPNNLAALHAILDDRARPYYEHQLAA